MMIKVSFFILFTFLAGMAMAQQDKIGIFDKHQDIGNPENSGSASFDPTTQTYTLTGSGYNIWFERDEFHYLYNEIAGDFILTADFAFEGAGTDPHRKVGWMIRETADENAAHLSATLHGDGLTVLNGGNCVVPLCVIRKMRFFHPKIITP